MHIAPQERIAAYTHAATIPVITVGTILLLLLATGNIALQSVSLVYGLSGIFLFTASFLYHAKKQRENDRSLWRKLDHSAIFFLIAGTYTPLCFLYLNGTMKWAILITQWFLVFAGTVFKILFINAPRSIGTSIYLLMGWIVIIPISTLIDTMPKSVLMLLITGGLSYTFGAIIYALKKPDPIPNFFGFHEIFHLFITAGATLHMLMIITGVKEYLQY